MRFRYPLEALHWLRRQRVDQQAAVVGESAARTARAARVEAEAERARRATAQRIAETQGAERSLLEEGALRAADLQLAGAWQAGAEAELSTKREAEHQARAARLADSEAEAHERRALGQASNQAKLIDEHRKSRRAEHDASQDLRDEEAVTEQWTASRFPPQRSR